MPRPSRVLLPQESRRVRWLRRLFVSVRLMIVLAVGGLFTPIQAADPIGQEVGVSLPALPAAGPAGETGQYWGSEPAVLASSTAGLPGLLVQAGAAASGADVAAPSPASAGTPAPAATPAPAGSVSTGSSSSAAVPATAPSTQPSSRPATPSDQVDPDVVEALKKLKSPDAKVRGEVYALLQEKADARIIPALSALIAGQLQLRDNRLVLYGDTPVDINVDGRSAKAYPLLDAITGEPVRGADGQPILETTKNLSTAFKRPLTVPQREPVLDLIAAMSLLHPNPEQRLASIRDAGERALRSFPNFDAEARLKESFEGYLSQRNKPLDKAGPAASQPAPPPAELAAAETDLAQAIRTALDDKPAELLSPVPSREAVAKVSAALAKAVSAEKALGADPATLPAEGRKTTGQHAKLTNDIAAYGVALDAIKKNTEDLPKYAHAFERQLAKEPGSQFVPALKEAKSMTDTVLGTPDDRRQAVVALGDFGTSRAANLLRKLYDSANRKHDAEVLQVVNPALKKAESYQAKIRFVQYTFAGLSSGSIYVLLALGLAIIFGLMGVINMAHGEFMMVGAFTTYVVASLVKSAFPGFYNFFPILAVPAAFLVSATFGLVTEFFVIRHLYGRTTETLLATIGVGIILVQVARTIFGDSLSYAAPSWMQGSWEVVPDLNLNRARLWTIVYCVLCITVVYFIVNKTKLGLLLRATTQNRKMAAALGVPTRLVDALTFGVGTGLAGMAGVVVPMIDKINPSMGGDYVVSSFMVVVVGGVGKLAGAILAGFGLGAIGNYLEPLLGSLALFARTSSVLSKVLVLAAIVLFLQWRPSGLFPPKGRVADA